jgi:V/A-type H+-transporting ATPase subunit E
MSIEKIYERIETQAAASADDIIGEAARQAARIRDEYAGRSAELGESLRAYAEKKAGEAGRRLIVSEQLELKKALLAKKREILARIYDDARKRIEGLGDEESAGIIREMILENAVSGREEIVVSGRQSSIFDGKFLDSLNSGFKGDGSFTLAQEKGSFPWGVVLREGRRVVDLSLDVVFEQLKEKVEPRIAALLFPETTRE